MSTRTLARVVSAAAVVALFGACADPSTAPAPTQLAPNAPSFAVTGGPDLSDWLSFQGEIWICKDGNQAGPSFAFDWSVVTRHGDTPVASGTVYVPLGTCVLAHHLDLEANVRAHITVAEQTPPPDWALTAIAYDWGNLPNAPEVPVVDIQSRSISEVHASNDNGVQITFFNTYTPPPPPPTCTYTQGFWKTHQELWDTNGEMVVWNGQAFFNSGMTYAEIFAMSAAGGNSYVKLGHQYMAAKLNVNFGFDPTIAGAIAQAEAFFDGHPAGSYFIKDGAWNALAGTLDDYNNGLTGPGHCGS